MERRSLLAGLGVASCAALTSSLVLPTTAKAHGGHGHGGHGHGGHGHGGHGHGGHGGCGNDPKDVVWGLLGALETMDADEIASWLHEDVLFQSTGLPDIVGSEPVRQFLGPFMAALESVTVDVVSMMSNGSLVCSERIEHYVVADDSPIGYPGSELTLRIAGLHEVHDGKMTRWSDYWDTRVAVAVLGIPLPMAIP